MKKVNIPLLVLLVGVGALILAFTPSLAKSARMPASRTSADRVVELQRTDTGWEGTWYWYVGSTGNATNLTGVTALGLLEAYQDTKRAEYLDASEAAADFIMTHLGIGATGTQYHTRATAPDIVFLHKLSKVTGNADYATRAILEWDNIKGTYPSAASLDSLFRSINRPSTWDIAFFVEAAYLSGDTTWANEGAAILADYTDDFYYGDTFWYALNLGGSIRALVESGYSEEYQEELVYLLNELAGLSSGDTGIDGWVQDTAYGVLAFRSVSGPGRQYANDLARWLAANQQENGGWDEGGNEYAEIDGEALRALSSTIGKNVTLNSWKPNGKLKASWKKSQDAEVVEPYVIE